jgi:S1-C subfamily serine protease
MDRQPVQLPTPAPRIWVPIAVSVLALLSSMAVVAKRLGSLQTRLEQAEGVRAKQASEVHTRLEGLQNELSGIREELGTAVHELAGTAELSERLHNAENDLGSIGAAIEAHSSSLLELEETQATFVPDIEQELREHDERLQKRYETLSEVAESARRTAADTEAKLSKLDQSLSATPDLHAMWRELVGPVVQLAGDASVGSGVLLPSEPLPEGGFRTRILTAWHVVRDIQGDPPDLELAVPVQIYREDASIRHEKAKLLAHDPKVDVALLELVTEGALEFGARLAPRSRLDEASTFDQVVAVGCPLGNDPIPTRGEIATCQHEVDGEHYWMINAPTYIGNSGGGIFDSKSHELLGIFSKIYTHGSLRPTIVPHMGLVTPMAKVYDWLEQVGHGEIVPVEHAPVAASAQ